MKQLPNITPELIVDEYNKLFSKFDELPPPSVLDFLIKLRRQNIINKMGDFLNDNKYLIVELTFEYTKDQLIQIYCAIQNFKQNGY
jgi:hypothetical protein